MRVTFAAGRHHRKIRRRVASLAAALHRAYGEADLGNLHDPIDELVYISLTRQTHAKNALRSWEAVREIGGARRLVTLEEDELATILRPSGFSRQKARWIRSSLEIIRQRMGELSLAAAEAWSDEKLEQFLCSLPGISIKSAKCIMLYSMGRDVLPVDTHVRRISARLGLVPDGLSERKVHAVLEDLVPAHIRRGLHVNLIWHGRAVCTAIRPRCSDCVVSRFCALRGREEDRTVVAVA